MKKAYIFVSVVLVFVLFPSIGYAAPDNTTVDVERVGNVVAISGQTDKGKSSRVTAKVINPAGGLDYLGQTMSNTDGSYHFFYQISSNLQGEYLVNIGGSGVEPIQQAAFRYEPSKEGPTADDSAFFDLEVNENAITISGKTAAGADEQVTAKVVNPAGGLDYLGQTISGTDGHFTFTYQIGHAQEGEYSVYIGGNGFQEIQHGTFVYEPADTAPPTFELFMNGNEIMEDATVEDSSILRFELHSEDHQSGVILETIIVDGDPYIEGNELDWAGDLGVHRIKIVVADEAGNKVKSSFTISVTTSASSINQLIERYSDTGELGGPLQKQLEQKLKQAEHHLNRGERNQAAKFMQDFLKHLHHQALQKHITENVRNVLDSDAKFLMSQWDS